MKLRQAKKIHKKWWGTMFPASPPRRVTWNRMCVRLYKVQKKGTLPLVGGEQLLESEHGN